jgi:hypothetical protein
VSDKPRLDGHLLHVESLVRLMNSGLTFVRVARGTPNGRLSLEALAFAGHAYRTTKRMIGRVELSAHEHARLQTQLEELREAIESCGGVVGD